MNLNLALSDTATISSADGEIDVSLDPANHGATFDYLKRIREQLIARYPNYTFFSMPADIVSQILNAGLPSPIDVHVVGHDPKNYQIAEELRQGVSGTRYLYTIRPEVVTLNSRRAFTFAEPNSSATSLFP